jgi:ABC-2 type transport system ATP-binding protein
MIEARQLTKRYGDRTAVDGVDFTVRPGAVTGFLGPNGAGKSTTMRLIIGLDAPTSGTVTVNGRRYARHAAPLHEVGALLEARSIHPGRSAFNHLMALAHTHGISRARVTEVIELTGLQSVAGRRAGAFSLGMGQRLGIAAALLGDPQTIMLDEPVNGLDPEGVLWIRTLLTGLASEGRTVFVSSHLMTEMALVADHLIVVGRGRVLADTTVSELVRQAGGDTVVVAAADPAELRRVLAAPGVEITGRPGSEQLTVTGLPAREIGLTAAAHGIALFELTAKAVSLEAAFMELTRESVEYHAVSTPGSAA